MHTNVHCSTVYNSKDLESTQMPIKDRVDKENVAYIYHRILCSHKKWWVHVLCRDMDEAGNNHSQQTDTRTENQPPRVVTHKWEFSNESTRIWEWNITHWGLLQGPREGQQGTKGRLGRDNMGRNARCGWRGWDGGSEPHPHVCTYATILHDLQM